MGAVLTLNSRAMIVRETAGGGFMLLIQDSAIAFADKIRELFDSIVADPERENPKMLGEDDTDTVRS
jgi:hypothetical protein